MVPVRDNGDLGRMAGVEVTSSSQRKDRNFRDRAGRTHRCIRCEVGE